MVPELGHLLLQRHQGPADLFDLVVAERAVIEGRIEVRLLWPMAAYDFVMTDSD